MPMREPAWHQTCSAYQKSWGKSLGAKHCRAEQSWPSNQSNTDVRGILHLDFLDCVVSKSGRHPSYIILVRYQVSYIHLSESPRCLKTIAICSDWASKTPNSTYRVSEGSLRRWCKGSGCFRLMLSWWQTLFKFRGWWWCRGKKGVAERRWGEFWCDELVVCTV